MNMKKCLNMKMRKKNKKIKMRMKNMNMKNMKRGKRGKMGKNMSKKQRILNNNLKKMNDDKKLNL